MNIEVFSLCDAATNDTGKLNILGAFDTIWMVQAPAIYPQCAIALRLRFNRDERGEHNIVVNFVDVDGRHIMPSMNSLIKMDFPGEQRTGSANLILNIQGLKIEKWGEYSIDLQIDGRNVSSLPLFVMPRQ
ncbi:MAG: hypothetical protein H6754_00885 [Candidatus Omnitrophica bacterium]|nr:hypothetical protein [Candidatus Omnitrophota bacterium]